MAEIYDLDAYRAKPEQAATTRNQELLARIQGEMEAANTPEAKLVNELRGMEETLTRNHRQYARLWEAANQQGITPPVRTAAEIASEADGMVPDGTPALPSSIEIPDSAHRAQFQHPPDKDIAR